MIGWIILVVGVLLCVIEQARAIAKERAKAAKAEADHRSRWTMLARAVMLHYEAQMSIEQVAFSLEASAFPKEHIADVIAALREAKKIRATDRWVRTRRGVDLQR